MLSKAQIIAASPTLDETDITMFTALIRGSEKYKQNPAYYIDFVQLLEDADGSVQAKQLNAAMSAIVDLGIGVVEIDQRRVGSSDGLYYSQVLERNALIDYMLGVLYEEYFATTPAVYDDDGNIVNSGGYYVAQRGD